jgi:hypothetical protein
MNKLTKKQTAELNHLASIPDKSNPLILAIFQNKKIGKMRKSVGFIQQHIKAALN